MRTLLLAMPLAMTASAALAGTLHCSFTEPFFSIDFDSATGIVTLISPDDADPETGGITPRVIAGGARLVRVDTWEEHPALLLEADGARILEIRVSGQGSDGMSDSVFPWDGKFGALVGGCESGVARAYDLYEAYRDLGIEE